MTEEFYDFIAYGMTQTGKLNFEEVTLLFLQTTDSIFRYIKKLCLSKPYDTLCLAKHVLVLPFGVTILCDSQVTESCGGVKYPCLLFA